MSNIRYEVGDAVRLKISCLGNPTGTVGYVFHTYNLTGEGGAQVIFTNGNYDGFGADEQDDFLEYLGTTGIPYEFTHVIKVSEHFAASGFKDAFEIAAHLSYSADV